MAWLRATVSRFANGETHARRRALTESLLAEMDPADLREEAAQMARGAAAPPGVIETPYLPVAVLARRLGAGDLGAAVAATRVVAAAYQPHTSHPDADAALATLLSLLPGGEDEVVAARVAILVQACEATAGLVRGEDVPVPVTRRVGPERSDDERSARGRGATVLVDLSNRPFGAGARRCPGEAHARALAEGLR
jgi:cytochrome P450